MLGVLDLKNKNGSECQRGGRYLENFDKKVGDAFMGVFLAALRSDDVALTRGEQVCENRSPRSIPDIFGTRRVVRVVLQQGASCNIKRHGYSLCDKYL